MSVRQSHLQLMDLRDDPSNPDNWFVTGWVYKKDLREGQELSIWFDDIEEALDFLVSELDGE